MSAGWTKVLPRMFSIFVVILSVSCGESRNKYGSVESFELWSRCSV